ncbi:MAG: YjiH family protein [Woeseiaceae bacterium]|nr:YjiH family protein [Woeseiaceae bacterium]
MADGSVPKPGAAVLIRFLLPSLVGAFVFLFPVRDGNVFTIPMAIMSNWLTETLAAWMPYIVLAIIAVSAVVTTIVSLRDGEDDGASELRRIFAVNRIWLGIRLTGFVMAVMIVFEVGPEIIWSQVTGHVVLFDLATAIVSIFVFAAFLMPLLTEYGLMDLVGTLLSRLFRKLFSLPGRSCIDALASWLSSAPVGVLITSQQFERGNYSGREAAVIATNFSVVSVPFCVIVANTVGLSHLFLQYYFVVVVCGVVAAIITPRLPPLSRIPDSYSEAGRQLHENLRPEGGLFRAGLRAAYAKAADAPGPALLIRTAVHNLFDIWFGLLPALIAIGTTGLILVEFTPIDTWLSYPFIPLLELFRLPEAAAAAPAMLVGFADMFLPAVIATSIESELTRFVVASVSITQLIYMTEVGVLILKTRIPLSLLNLFQVFLLRTAITLPISVALAHWWVFR